MQVSITLDKEQKIVLQVVDAFGNELNRRIKNAIPSSRVTVKKAQ